MKQRGNYSYVCNALSAHLLFEGDGWGSTAAVFTHTKGCILRQQHKADQGYAHVISLQEPDEATLCLLQLFNGRRQWLNGCDDIAGWVERTAQSVLQLERSREGLVWSQANGIDENAFADCQTLMQQRQYLASTLESAKLEVRCCLSLSRLSTIICQCCAAVTLSKVIHACKTRHYIATSLCTPSHSTLSGSPQAVGKAMRICCC